MSEAKLPPLPASWSELTWQQLTAVWTAKMRYGGNADVARCAAFLALVNGEGFRVKGYGLDERTGERLYLISGNHEPRTMNHEPAVAWTVTPRSLAHLAKQALPWLDFPYGDPGEPAQKDEQGRVVREAREPVRGLVGPMRDALALQEQEVTVGRRRFALPQVAMNNLTWQQYRSLQAVTPQLFREGIGEGEALALQAQFMAHCLVPRSLALLDSSGRTIKLRPHWTYEYDAERAEGLVGWWQARLSEPRHAVLFHICFQVYQTAIAYYASAYPLLFSGDGKQDAMRDVLQGEVGTINTIMKYAGYAEQQQVYDSNLPFVLDILNTMTKEAKEIEKMNSKIKRK